MFARWLLDELRAETPFIAVQREEADQGHDRTSLPNCIHFWTKPKACDLHLLQLKRPVAFSAVQHLVPNYLRTSHRRAEASRFGFWPTLSWHTVFLFADSTEQKILTDELFILSHSKAVLDAHACRCDFRRVTCLKLSGLL